jgi:hypothetical protein
MPGLLRIRLLAVEAGWPKAGLKKRSLPFKKVLIFRPIRHCSQACERI